MRERPRLAEHREIHGMQRHLELGVRELRQPRRHERAHALAAEHREHLTRHLVRPGCAAAPHIDSRALERAREIGHHALVAAWLDRDGNVHAVPALGERAELADRRDEHHPCDDDEQRECVRIAA